MKRPFQAYLLMLTMLTMVAQNLHGQDVEGLLQVGDTAISVYATDIDLVNRTAVIHVESVVKNDGLSDHNAGLMFTITDADGNIVTQVSGEDMVTVTPRRTAVLKAQGQVPNLNLWLWGSNALYTVETKLREVVNNGSVIAFVDPVRVSTGFRQASFRDGFFQLSDQELMPPSHSSQSSQPSQLRLTAHQRPGGTKANGADMVLIEVEVVDSEGNRCSLDNRTVHFQLWGEARWIGSAASRSLSQSVACGVGRVLLASTSTAGEIGLSVYADGLKAAYLTLESLKE